MDDDENLLAVECALRPATAAHPNATLSLRLTVGDAAAALIEYSPGAAVHGSQMWNCRNETILGTVDSAAITGPHSVSLLLSRAGYEKIFDRAEILFQQPTVNADDAEAETQSQPQSGESSSAPTPAAAAGGGPMRRMLALPPSTGSLPFDFPDSVTAAPETTRSGAVPESRQRSPARSRDREFRGLAAPEILLSGNHPEIARWRKEQSLARTRQRGAEREAAARAKNDKKNNNDS